MTATLDVEAEQSTENLALTFKHNNSIVKLTLSNEDFKEKSVTWVTLKSGSTAVATVTGTLTGDADKGSIVAYFAVKPQNMQNIAVIAVCEEGYYAETLTDKMLGTGKLYNVSKAMTKVTGSVTAVQAVKGDFALLDGTFISNDATLTNAEKACVSGIVFWTTADSNTSGNTPAKLTDDKIMAKDFPHCTHGLIVSLKDVSTTTKWQNSATKIADWQNSNAFNPENKSDYKSIASNTDAKDPIDYILGYQNTKILQAYNAQCEEANKMLPVFLLDTWKETNPAPANTTGWFIPSVKELTLLCGVDSDYVYGDNFGTSTKTALNTILTSLGTDYAASFPDRYYWSSSEYVNFTGYAFSVYFSRSDVDCYGGKFSRTYYVRAVCAY